MDRMAGAQRHVRPDIHGAPMTRWTLGEVVAAKARMEGAQKRDEGAALFHNEVMKGFIEPFRASHPLKYGNKKTNGYASKREANRARELKAMEAAGDIQRLEEQVEYVLIPAQYENGKCVERACKYIGDFRYVECLMSGYSTVVEDAKGYRDPVYRLKRKLMLKVHGIRIREV
jgi:hypothetical protein